MVPKYRKSAIGIWDYTRERRLMTLKALFAATATAALRPSFPDSVTQLTIGFSQIGLKF